MKIRISLQKKFTLNTQNYSSISPAITLDIVDGVDAENVSDAHRYLSTIADLLLHEQIEDDAKTMATMKALGFSKYFKSLDHEKMDEQFEQVLQKLIHVDNDIPF
jgi:hypothetical protein